MQRSVVIALVLAGWLGCDRNVEPFDPNEQPAAPDLSRIFPPAAEAAGGEGPPIRGTVSVADELAGRVPPGAVLFLIARRGGGGPPLAVERTPSPRFPLEFSL